MYIRCIDCRRSTWIEPVETHSSDEFVCPGCGRASTINGSPELGSGAHDQFQNALKLANRHNLDLPCAWSVLAGAMTLRQARACRSDMGLEKPDGSRPSERRARDVESGGPAADDVADGATPPDTTQDSGRDEAQRLAKQHDLPLSLARRVVKKEINLAAALLMKPTFGKPGAGKSPEAGPESVSDAVPTGPGRWIPRRRTAAIAAAALVLVVALVLVGSREAEEVEASQQRVAPSDTEILRDPDGQLVGIVGSDPEDVLIAYCSEERNRCKPLKLTLGSPPRAGLRLGIFRGPGESLGAIEIRRQGQARRWVAGDGQARIPAVSSTELPPGTVELPARTL